VWADETYMCSLPMIHKDCDCDMLPDSHCRVYAFEIPELVISVDMAIDKINSVADKVTEACRYRRHMYFG
jgi:hypothetical protein